MGIMFPLYLLSKNNEMLLISSEHKCEMCSVSDSYPSCDNIRETSDIGQQMVRCPHLRLVFIHVWFPTLTETSKRF